MDAPELSVRELDALFDQAPVAMVFRDPELRTRRTNAAFRELTGLPDEALIGRRPSEADAADHVMDTGLIQRTLAEQVINAGGAVVGMHLEHALAGRRRVFSWSAYRVTDSGRLLGVVSTLTDITGPVQAAAALRQANARLDLLQRAGGQIGTTLDIYRTAEELAALAVPELADRVTVDLLEPVLQGEDPLTARSGELRFRRVAVRDAATDATVGFAVGDLITRPTAGRSVAALLRGEPLLARNPAEMRQADMVPSHVATLLDRGVHTVMLVPLTAHGVTLGIAVLSRAEHPGPYDEAHLRLVADLAARAAVHIDNAPRARRGGDLAAQPAAPRHPAGGRPGHRLPTATGRPAKPRRSAATGSTSSRSTTARWRWWSAT